MKKGFLLAGIVMGLEFQALATTIQYNSNTDGTTAPAGGTFTASGSLGTKTVAGWTILGVRGGNAGNEIDIGQFLQVNFAQPVHIDHLTLGLLFDGPEFDDANETAVVLVDGVTTYTLRATGRTTALWTGSGTVLNLSPADSANAAVWQIANPFGVSLVNTIRFFPVNPPSSGSLSESSARTRSDADFGLQGLSASAGATSVPDVGATLGLLSIALGGLAVFARRFRA
jgi:hypothetical protein